MNHQDQSAIPELPIVDEHGATIFDRNDIYSIPLYQRAYAWGDEEITQLIDDLCGIAESASPTYYLGSLIVKSSFDEQRRLSFEVIDGQQRLTTLYILLRCLGYPLESSLKFDCRDKSNDTLHASNFLELVTKQDNPKYSSSILKAGKTILDQLSRKYEDTNQTVEELLRKALPHVLLFRIEVPPKTNLNRYFEIMNTRGEQLELHDILKARLMGYLPSAERASFAAIWEACSNMDGYVPMHFTNTKERAILFGENWDELPQNASFDAFQTSRNNMTDNHDDSDSNEEAPPKITEIIIDSKYRPNKSNTGETIRTGERFEPIIKFPYFLLHVLHVLAYVEMGMPEKITDDAADTQNSPTQAEQTPALSRQLDDKELLKEFKQVEKYASQNSLSKADFARMTIRCLLRCRVLFDNYFIKRDHEDEKAQHNSDRDGVWSLKYFSKYLSATQDEPKPQPQYKPHSNPNIPNIIMLQACLRVSYTSPKSMHWITTLLSWLYKASQQRSLNYQNRLTSSIYYNGYHEYIEGLVRKAVVNDFLISREIVDDFLTKNGGSSDYFCRGVGTPHIALNYLDYLFWSQPDRQITLGDGQQYPLWDKKQSSDFVFSFRNSIEHWHPQHSPEDPWEKEFLDNFGNLCLMPRNENSSLSDQTPLYKKGRSNEIIQHSSLKLRQMAEITRKQNGWDRETCVRYGKIMISLLKDACAKELPEKAITS